jgi:3',5'-cyclic AMP phosphodiesterase CpdA
MPHLLDRRSFLAVASVPLTLPFRDLFADDATRPELKFLVITDTHLGYKGNDSAAKLWTKTAAELAKQDGAFVLHLGDVVDGGREEQYPIYLKTRESIGKPVHEIPGNHDPQPLFEKHLRPKVDTAFDHQWLRVILLNNSHTDSHDGFLTREQRDFLSRQLNDARETSKAVIVAMHVPAHDNKHPDRGWHVKPKDGQSELYELVTAKNSPVLALFHGHFHNGLRGWDDRKPVHEICFPSALYNQDRKLEEQKAPGFNPIEFRPGYTAITLRKDKLLIDYRVTGTTANVTRECALA